MSNLDEAREQAARFLAPLKDRKAAKRGDAEPDLMAAAELFTGLCVNIARLCDLVDGIDTRLEMARSGD